MSSVKVDSLEAELIQALAAERAFVDTRIARLETALRPFVAAYEASACDVGDSDLDNEQPRAVYVTLGDCRKAARILKYE